MKNESIKGENKILHTFKDFVKTDVFIDKVKHIRKLVNLPSGGVEPTEKDLEKLSDKSYVPDYFSIKKTEDPKQLIRTLNLEMYRIAELLPVDNEYLNLLVRGYIFYDEFFYKKLESKKAHLRNSNVCMIDDAQSEFEEYAPSDDPESTPRSVFETIDNLQLKLWKYPVVLRIHQDASQRDIIRYIKAHQSEIEKLQNSYRAEAKNASYKNSKTGIDKNEKRNDFIYENRDNLSRKEILQQVHEKFGVILDPGTIGRIIWMEKKKREKK